jgi:hypothetical protein
LTTLLESALSYAARGWHVFPLKPRDKTPRTAGGFKAGTTDESQIRRWWTTWPDSNIGVATGQGSGIIAIDAVAKNRTMFVIAHRLATVVDSDVIVVLKDGEVVGIGSHQELLKSTPLYKQLAKQQKLA